MMVEYARKTKASVVVSSYNEPLITSEWAVEIFKEAKANGLMCAYVSNGNNTPEVIEYLAPYLSAYKVDLKCMNDKSYRKLGGTLQHTLDGIQRAREAGLWVEVVTLVIPGFNDSNEELWDAARFLSGLSVDIPWHVTAFHKDYKMTEPDNTDAKTLIRAAEIGREAGLRFVYAGNLPGHVGEYEETRCPRCSYGVVKRRGYVVHEYHITGEGKCEKCGESIPWPSRCASLTRLSCRRSPSAPSPSTPKSGSNALPVKKAAPAKASRSQSVPAPTWFPNGSAAIASTSPLSMAIGAKLRLRRPSFSAGSLKLPPACSNCKPAPWMALTTSARRLRCRCRRFQPDLVERPALNIFYIGMTNTFAPYDDVRVRQAIAYGIDRQRIVDNFYPAGSEKASHFTPCAIPNAALVMPGTSSMPKKAANCWPKPVSRMASRPKSTIAMLSAVTCPRFPTLPRMSRPS
jgi:pyruvate-formate lyase-activating enzyme